MIRSKLEFKSNVKEKLKYHIFPFHYISQNFTTFAKITKLLHNFELHLSSNSILRSFQLEFNQLYSI